MHAYFDQYEISNVSVTWRPEDREVRLVAGDLVLSMDLGEARYLLRALQEIIESDAIKTATAPDPADAEQTPGGH